MSAEAVERFGCFGGTCEVRVAGPGRRAAALRARGRLLAWHDRFTRFDARSELSRVNADPRACVPVSATMAALAAAVAAAGERTGGLVDGTLLAQIEAAGYRSRPALPVPPALLLRLAPARAPARPARERRWRTISVSGGLLRRPPGVAIDGGGLAKGLFADLLADELASADGFVIDCCGDLRLAGTVGRAVHVSGPQGAVLHTFELRDGGVATSGIGRRSWIGPDGRVAHHLLDPASGRPAFTGVAQATALAPTALEAEIRAKAALLSGPDTAAGWLEHGGAVVLDDGSCTVIEAALSAAAR